MALEQWVPRALDQSSANPTKTIQLAADSVIYETWSLPFPSAEDFIEQGKAVMAAYAEQSPKGKHVAVLFTAIGADGNITTQQPSSFIGKNQAADALVGSGNGAAKAFADSMALLVTSMNVILKAGYTMVEAQTKANESLVEQLVDMREYIKAIHEQEIERLARLAQQEPSRVELPAIIKEQLAAMLPQVQQAAGLYLDHLMTKKTEAAATTKAVTGINQATSNGVQ